MTRLIRINHIGRSNTISSPHWMQTRTLSLRPPLLDQLFQATSESIGRISVLPTFHYIPATSPIVIPTVYATSNVYHFPKTITEPNISHVELMHELIAHASTDRLYQLGIGYIPGNCNYCILGKQTRVPVARTNTKQTRS